MQVVVKTPHIEIQANGEIPDNLMEILKENFGEAVQILDDELIDPFKTDWFKEISEKTTPGDTIKIYRENRNWTQTELGEKLGGLSKQNVSDLETGQKKVSLNMAKKLSKLFKRPVDYFV